MSVGSAAAVETPRFIAEVMPPAACLASPDRACLLAAFENVVSRFERQPEGTKTAALRLFMAIDRGLDDPTVDALFLRLDPKFQPDRLKAMRADRPRPAANASEQVAGRVVAPKASELPAERARIVAMADQHERVSRTNKIIDALVRAHRVPEAEALLAVVQKSMHGRDATLSNSMAVTAARSFGEAGEWPAWSRSLTAGGYRQMMAAARTESDPESDPTEIGVEEPLRQGIPVKGLLPWIARAKDPAFRDTLVTLVARYAFDRGRVAAWKSDLDGFRRYVVSATARGELLHHPEYPFDSGDETLSGLCRDEARGRGDRALGLVADLQKAIQPPTEDGPVDRDRLRERVLDALADALVVAQR